METTIVVAVVLAAVAFLGLKLFKKVKSGGSCRECACGCGCGSCPGSCPGSTSSGMKPSQPSAKGGTSSPKISKRAAIATTSIAAMVLTASPAFAADTVEAYAPGEVSFEAYQSFEGFRNGRTDLTLGTEGLIGIGIAQYLSAQVGFSFSSNGYLAESDSGFSLTLLSTVLDGEKFDLDLMLTADTGAITPSIELNFDATERFGAYLRLAAPMSGGDKAAEDTKSGDDAPWELDVGLDIVPGIYFNVAEGHQLLLEGAFNLAWCDAEDKSGNLDQWSLALGYNFMVTEKAEIVTEVKTFRPDGGDQEFGITVGVIGSLP